MLLKSYVLYFLCAFLLLLYNESTFHVLFFCFSTTTLLLLLPFYLDSCTAGSCLAHASHIFEGMPSQQWLSKSKWTGLELPQHLVLLPPSHRPNCPSTSSMPYPTSQLSNAHMQQQECYDPILPPFYFSISLTFFSHMILRHLISHLTLVTWPDDHLTFLSYDLSYCSHCLLFYSPLSAIYGDLIVSEPIVLLPIVLPCYCLCLHCPQSPIVCPIRTLSHGSCLSSI